MNDVIYQIKIGSINEPCIKCQGYGKIFLEDTVEICTECMGDGYKKD